MSSTMPDLNYSSVHVYFRHDDYVELMPTWGYAASAFVLFLIGFFGFFLNLMVIILMFKDKQLWTPLNLILFNLVCSDFSVSILGNPFTLISSLAHRWVFGKTMCVLYGFFMTLLGITSITTLSVLSFERYMMVSRPLVSRHLSMRGASISIFFIWSYSFLVTSPPLFGWGRFVNEAANISCSINWEDQSFNTLTYILFLFGFGLILPVFVITFSYMNIIRTMKKNAVRMGRVTKAETRVTMMVFIMILTFMIAWTPYAILALIEQFAPHDIVSPGLGVVPALVAKSSICYDPIIYVGMNTQFLTSFKRMFGYGDKEDSMQERGLNNTLISPTKAASQFNESNIKLQYLNPNNNTVVAVTIYQDDDFDPRDRVDNATDVKIKKKQDKLKKKITLTGRFNQDESTEHSLDSYVKDGNDLLHSCSAKKANENVYNKIPKTGNKISMPYILRNTVTTESTDSIKDDPKIQRDETKFPNGHKYEEISENSSSGNLGNDFHSNDMLVSGNNRNILNDKGTVNNAMNYWDDPSWANPEFSHRDQSNLFSYSSSFFNDSPASARRKSFTSSQSKFKPDSDMRITKHGRRRKSSSSSVLAGHTRKLSAALHDNKGNIVTRLMVDERERSKLMCFEETKAIVGDHREQDGEQML